MGKERKIYLVRHGELYEKGRVNRCLGHTDVPLTERGERQAQKTAGWFWNRDIDRIYCSPLKRCVRTAQIICREIAIYRHGIEITFLDDLREMDVGKWENLSFDEIREKYPDEYEARGMQLGYYAPPDGESFYQAGERFRKCLNEVRKETDGNILIVSHAGVIRGYLSGLLNISPNDVFTIPQPYVGITVLQETDTDLKAEKIGWKPSKFFDEEEIQHLYHKCRTPEPVIQHMEAVAKYLDELKLRLGSLDYEWEILKKAALVHDICRTEREHAKVGAEILRKEGYEDIAKLVEVHHSSVISKDTVFVGMCQISEEELLFYADKRCEFAYKPKVMPTNEPLKKLKVPYTVRNPVIWGFFRLKHSRKNLIN